MTEPMTWAARSVDVAGLLAVMFALAACGDDGADSATEVDSEIEAIVLEWAGGWVDDEPDRVLALYEDDGVHADAAYPFELNGKPRIGQMVRGLLSDTDFTTSEATEIDPSDDGAVVQWIWAGTYRGAAFSMDAQTTFVISDGVITSSTDSYFRPDAPWTGQYLGGTLPWEVVAQFGDAVWAGDLDTVEALLDPDVVRTVGAPGEEFYEQVVGRDSVMEAYRQEAGEEGGHGPAVSTAGEALTIEGGIVTQVENTGGAFVTEVSDQGLIVRLEQQLGQI